LLGPEELQAKDMSSGEDRTAIKSLKETFSPSAEHSGNIENEYPPSYRIHDLR